MQPVTEYAPSTEIAEMLVIVMLCALLPLVHLAAPSPSGFGALAFVALKGAPSIIGTPAILLECYRGWRSERQFVRKAGMVGLEGLLWHAFRAWLATDTIWTQSTSTTPLIFTMAVRACHVLIAPCDAT